MSARWAMHPGRRDGDLVNVVTEEDGTEVGLVWNAENATLASAVPELLAALEATEVKLTQAARAFYGAGSAKAHRVDGFIGGCVKWCDGA